MEPQTAATDPPATHAASCLAAVVLSVWSASHADASSLRHAAAERTDLEPTRLILLELWPRILVAANIDTAATGTGLDVQFATGGAPFSLSRERAPSEFVLRVNRDFVAENDRLIEGLLVANRLNLQESFRSFALDRAVALGRAGTDAAVPVKTFNESIGWSADGFERVRGQAGFHEATGAARRQGFAWLLARVLAQTSLPLRQGVQPSIDSVDKRAAQLTFEISGSPFPPLPTGLLTAALERPPADASEASISCAIAAWLAAGVTIMRALPEFDRRLERDSNLRRSMAGVKADMGWLHDRGRCAASL